VLVLSHVCCTPRHVHALEVSAARAHEKKDGCWMRDSVQTAYGVLSCQRLMMPANHKQTVSFGCGGLIVWQWQWACRSTYIVVCSIGDAGMLGGSVCIFLIARVRHAQTRA
jgi:hypothetical protein